jgi:hypothetical protein
MRVALAGLLGAAVLIAAFYLGWSGLGSNGRPVWSSSAAEEPSWQLRELAFLKAAYDRTQLDMARPTEADASLQAERDRIVQRMAETAKLLQADAVPPEVRALLPESETPPGSLSGLFETIEAEGHSADLPRPPPPDLRVGLTLRRKVIASGLSVERAAPSGGSDAEFATDPTLREPIRLETATGRAERPARRKPRDDTGRAEP